MSKKSNPLDYITFNKKQGDNFLKEVENIVSNELNRTGNQSSIHKYDNNKFKKYGFYVEVINGIKSPLKNYYFLRKDVFNPLSQNKDYLCKAISYNRIEKFMDDFFSNYDLANPEKNAIDIGKLESITLKEIEERNYIVKPTTQITDKLEVVSKSSLDQDFIKKKLEEFDWAMYTYGEKIVEDHQGVATRIFYVKERPVQFKDLKITLKNTDSARIVMREDIENRNGVVLMKSNLIYHGGYQIFERKNADSDSILYLETESLADEKDRHLRLHLSLGKKVNEIGLGTFSLIKDFGPLLAGTALLVRKEKDYFENNECKFYTTFKDESKTVPRAIRILLERRSRAYVKLPRVLSNYTLKNLESYLIKQKHKERKYYESRDVIIHRKDAFISIPLNCNGSEFSDKYNTLLKRTVQLFGNAPFNLREITYGTIKHQNQESISQPIPRKTKKENHNHLESPGSREEYESNFDKIIQSNLVIFIYPSIAFPYEPVIKDSKKIQNENINNISTAFMEMGFAIGLRKKILILTSAKVVKTFPSIIKKFAQSEEKFVEIITCDVDTEASLISSFKKHETTILSFLDAHLDYEIIEE